MGENLAHGQSIQFYTGHRSQVKTQVRNRQTNSVSINSTYM